MGRMGYEKLGEKGESGESMAAEGTERGVML